jgi:type IV pilus assembly protein PilW
MKKIKYLQQGFTLIEILIALLIGLILMGGVISLMLNSKRAYNVQSDLAGLQENARFVVDSVAKDARMAGYRGCSGGLAQAVQGLNNQTISNITSDISSDVLLISFTDTSRNAFSITHCPPFEVYGQLFGLDSTAYQAICPPVGNTNFPAPSPFMTDRTTFAFDYTTTAPSFATCNNSSSGLACFGVGGDIRTGDTVVVSDCNGSDQYIVGNVGFAGGRPISVTLNQGLRRFYANMNGSVGIQSYGSEMRRLVTHRYYVAGVGNGVVDNGPLRFVLCRDAANTLDTTAAPLNCQGNNAEILVEGIENMQLRYLVNTGSTTVPTFQYVRASNNINWDLVRGIRVTLLVQTTEARTDRDVTSQPYSLDEDDYSNYSPTDLTHLRRVFSNTVMLRNRS